MGLMHCAKMCVKQVTRRVHLQRRTQHELFDDLEVRTIRLEAARSTDVALGSVCGSILPFRCRTYQFSGIRIVDVDRVGEPRNDVA